MSENKGVNYGPLILIGAVLYIATQMFGGKDGKVPPDDEDKKPNPVVVTDTLAEAHQKDRQSKIRILKSLAENDFPNDQAKLDYWKSEVSAAMTKDYKVFTDDVAVHLYENRLSELIKKMEKADD